ncbi:putative mitochondrial protein [Vitis vinifera]|uniref:Putative mitochondrial protein n=1 Tax=Vitis vinifera TaxID=29760 RepID=A0A438FPD6_VITVI|nr:putative mitochondrial protein [Vitis vinifera]
MFITMDVVFHENSMYFSSESELQGEYHKEIQTLDYNFHISKENESGQSELVNQEAGELDMSGTILEPSSNDHPKAEEVIEEGRDSTIEPSEQFGFEDAFIEILNQSSSTEGVLNLEPDPFMKRLPHRHNKARLVAKWYTQTYGIDYTKTFAPVAKINTVRVLLSSAANLDWPLQQFDVKNAFLHGELSKEVYMDLPPGCMVSEKEGLKLCVEPNQVSTDKGRYQRLVERLMYLAYTRPDLAYALSVNAPGKGILFAKNVDHQNIEVYIDADWVGVVDDRRSTSGYFTFVGGNLVTWKSKKQNVIARSSAEAEFRGMTLGLCEALWLNSSYRI